MILIAFSLNKKIFPVAMMTNIQQAFLQIEIDVGDRNFTIFFWDNEPCNEKSRTNFKICRWTKVLFRCKIKAISSSRFHETPPSKEYKVKRVKEDTSLWILTFEELTTLIAQIGAVLNFRTLMPFFDDPNDFAAFNFWTFLCGWSLLMVSWI